MIPGVKEPAQRYRIPRKVTAPVDVEWALREVHTPRARRGPRRDGILFELGVSRVLSQVRPPWFYAPGPWISFREEPGGPRHNAQPDGLLVNFQEGLVVICEMKLRHTGKAERQLRDKYLPLVSELFPAPQWKIRLVEIYKYWDFVETGMKQTPVWNCRGWGKGVYCYGWQGELPRGLGQNCHSEAQA